MSQSDHYSLLCVPRNASSDEIRRAYRKLVLRWHPDQHPSLANAAEQLRQVNEAYAVLRDDEARRHYDHLLGLYSCHRYARHSRHTLPRSVAARRRKGAVAMFLVLGLTVIIMFAGLSLVSELPGKWMNSLYSRMEPEPAVISGSLAPHQWVIQYQVVPSSQQPGNFQQSQPY
jgi:curved DNA-binding protein CbpA